MRPFQVSLTLGVGLSLMTMVFQAWSQSVPPNNMFDSRIVLVGPETNVVASNVGATKEPGEPDHALRKGGKSVWWTWTAPADITVSIDTVGSTFDTVLAIYTGESVSAFKFVAGNDDMTAGVTQSRVIFQASSGTNYQIAVDGFGAQEGTVNLRLRQGPLPPEIASPPLDTTGAFGTAVTLGMTTLGDAPLAFQWAKDGVDIPDGTNSSYTIASVTQADAGAYRVTITNIAGVASSVPASLTVSPLVLMTQPVSTTASAAYPATLKVSAIGAAPLSYEWRKDGVPIPGAVSTQYKITAVQPTDAGVYSVVVTNLNGEITTSNAVLSVVAPYTFTTLAGAPRVSGTNDGPGSAARFYYPHGIALDESGNVYVSELGNEAVRKITPDGNVSTVVRLRAPQPAYNPYNGPWGVAVDHAGNIYISDTPNNTIVKALPDGTVNTLAGTAGPGGLVDGTNGAARFMTPSALLIDGSGNLLVADWGNGRIRKVTAEGVVTTIATKSSMNMPSGLGVDDRGNLYVSVEGFNYLARVSPNGFDTGLSGSLDGPHGAAVDALGNVYTADMNSARVIKVIPDGSTLVLGGLLRKPGSVDGAGTQARFFSPRGIVVDKTGTVYVTDYENHTIRKGVPFAVTNLLQDQTVLSGSSVTLRVDAWGAEPFFFQWYFGSTALTGQTTNSLTLGSVSAGDAGVYSVRIRDSNGNTITSKAVVTVLMPSVIETVQTTEAGRVHLLFRHVDGTLPSDLSRVTVQWCDDLGGGTSAWQASPPNLSLTNGYVLFVDTNLLSQTRFYRIQET